MEDACRIELFGCFIFASTSCTGITECCSLPSFVAKATGCTVCFIFLCCLLDCCCWHSTPTSENSLTRSICFDRNCLIWPHGRSRIELFGCFIFAGVPTSCTGITECCSLPSFVAKATGCTVCFIFLCCLLDCCCWHSTPTSENSLTRSICFDRNCLIWPHGRSPRAAGFPGIWVITTVLRLFNQCQLWLWRPN